MTTPPRARIFRLAVGLVTALLVLAGCGGAKDPMGGTPATSAPPASASTRLVVGSQAYYSNEIIAELFSQALEAKGFTIDRQYQIGQREVYMKEFEAGKIDLLPEYSGNLLQYYDKATTAKSGDEVNKALAAKLPSGIRALQPAAATDQDSYNVTKDLAAKYGLVSIADLSKVPGPIKVAANSELAVRPYGPPGLKSAYGLDVTVIPVEDSAGPLTVKALKDGTAQVADLYSADPSIVAGGFVTLTDPKNLILPQAVTPIASAKVTPAAVAVVKSVTDKLTMAELLKLNSKSIETKASSKVLATEWLAAQGLS